MRFKKKQQQKSNWPKREEFWGTIGLLCCKLHCSHLQNNLPSITNLPWNAAPLYQKGDLFFHSILSFTDKLFGWENQQQMWKPHGPLQSKRAKSNVKRKDSLNSSSLSRMKILSSNADFVESSSLLAPSPRLWLNSVRLKSRSWTHLATPLFSTLGNGANV